MTIGIDISQLAYPDTGVANYLKHLLLQLIKTDKTNEYKLFFSSLRGTLDEGFITEIASPNVTIKQFRLPPTALDFLWNRLHLLSIEYFLGDIDVFISSDWVEPPVERAKKITILYDLIVYKHPEESAEKIVATQKRKLAWVTRETDAVLCISEATKKDALEILKIPEEKLHVVYPGFTL